MSGKLAEDVLGRLWVNHTEKLADEPTRVAEGRKLYRTGSVREYKVTPNRCEVSFSDSQKAIVSMKGFDDAERGVLSSEIGRLVMHSEKDTDISFPAMKKMRFECSCSDSARCCKHAIAAMISMTENESKALLTFFGLSMDSVENKAVQDSIDLMLSKSDCVSDRIIIPELVKKLFGV